MTVGVNLPEELCVLLILQITLTTLLCSSKSNIIIC